MNLAVAAQYMKVGYRIRRKAWIGHPHKEWISSEPNYVTGGLFHPEDFWADDWEIVFEDMISDSPIEYKFDYDEEEEDDL